jgi:hypothetical protein
VNRCGLEVKGANGDSAAFMSFHRPNIIAANFGIDENNYLAFGGWSFGGNSYKVWHGGFGIPVWQTPSDRRLKKNIKPIGSALEFIRQTKPIRFEYNSLLGKEHFGDKFQRKKVHYGFLADDFPIQDLVAEREGEGYLGLDYIEIIPFLCRAVQEQQTQIQELQAQVSDLKNHLVTDLN